MERLLTLEPFMPLISEPFIESEQNLKLIYDDFFKDITEGGVPVSSNREQAYMFSVYLLGMSSVLSPNSNFNSKCVFNDE